MSNQTPEKPIKAGKKWSQEDNFELLDLIENGNSIEDVALKLGRTPSAIKSRLIKEMYYLICQGDWTVEELSNKYNLTASEISNYQEREDKKKLNPPQKQTTRSETLKLSNKDEEYDKQTNDTKRSFSSATKTRSILIPTSKIANTKETNIKQQTYEDKSLALLTEIRDSLKIIASKK